MERNLTDSEMRSETTVRLPRVRAGRKSSFDIEKVLPLIAAAIGSFKKAALFELVEAGYNSLFEILIACIISIRTRDEATVPIARRLFAAARTPAEVAALDIEQIDSMIAGCTFHESKSRQIKEIAGRVLAEHGGILPANYETLIGFHGVGPKCANLALGISGESVADALAPGVGVDVHVHRITNRWGYVSTSSPVATMRELHRILPRKYWVRINALLVPFGKHICTNVRPHCSQCPVAEFCRQVGVTEYR